MIRYDDYNKRVKQEVNSIGLYSLEGSSDDVIAEIERKCKDVINVEHKITETNYNGGSYLDGTRVKTVKFDECILEMHEDYDTKYLSVMGVRDYLPEELKVLKEKTKTEKQKQDERERAEFERLKKKFDG